MGARYAYPIGYTTYVPDQEQECLYPPSYLCLCFNDECYPIDLLLTPYINNINCQLLVDHMTRLTPPPALGSVAAYFICSSFTPTTEIVHISTRVFSPDHSPSAGGRCSHPCLCPRSNSRIKLVGRLKCFEAQFLRLIL